MRTTYIVAYDICDPKRLMKVYKKMRGFGDRVQLSVFKCDLGPADLARMKEHLGRLVDPIVDQVLIVPLGPPGGSNDRRIESVGRPWTEPERAAVVV
jgi:CRISPR-associated protein Cas2